MKLQSAVIRSGRKRKPAPLADGLVDAEAVVAQLPEEGDKHHPVLHCDPQQTDEGHRCRDRKRHAPGPNGEDPSHQGKGQVQNHQQGVPEGAQGHVQQAEDKEERRRHNDGETLHGPLLVLELAAVFKEIAGGQFLLDGMQFLFGPQPRNRPGPGPGC